MLIKLFYVANEFPCGINKFLAYFVFKLLHHPDNILNIIAQTEFVLICVDQQGQQLAITLLCTLKKTASRLGRQVIQRVLHVAFQARPRLRGSLPGIGKHTQPLFQLGNQCALLLPLMHHLACDA